MKKIILLLILLIKFSAFSQGKAKEYTSVNLKVQSGHVAQTVSAPVYFLIAKLLNDVRFDINGDGGCNCRDGQNYNFDFSSYTNQELEDLLTDAYEHQIDQMLQAGKVVDLQGFLEDDKKILDILVMSASNRTDREGNPINGDGECNCSPDSIAEAKPKLPSNEKIKIDTGDVGDGGGNNRNGQHGDGAGNNIPFADVQGSLSGIAGAITAREVFNDGAGNCNIIADPNVFYNYAALDADNLVESICSVESQGLTSVDNGGGVIMRVSLGEKLKQGKYFINQSFLEIQQYDYVKFKNRGFDLDKALTKAGVNQQVIDETLLSQMDSMSSILSDHIRVKLSMLDRAIEFAKTQFKEKGIRTILVTIQDFGEPEFIEYETDKVGQRSLQFYANVINWKDFYDKGGIPIKSVIEIDYQLLKNLKKDKFSYAKIRWHEAFAAAIRTLFPLPATTEPAQAGNNFMFSGKSHIDKVSGLLGVILSVYIEEENEGALAPFVKSLRNQGREVYQQLQQVHENHLETKLDKKSKNK